MRSVVTRVGGHLGWEPFERREPMDLLGVARRLAGTYVTDDGVRFELVLGPDEFRLVVPGQPGLRLEPVDPTTWVASGILVELRAEVDDEGRPERVVLHQLGHAFRATRGADAPTPDPLPEERGDRGGEGRGVGRGEVVAACRSDTPHSLAIERSSGPNVPMSVLLAVTTGLPASSARAVTS